jgi:hypothetical protein
LKKEEKCKNRQKGKRRKMRGYADDGFVVPVSDDEC